MKNEYQIVTIQKIPQIKFDSIVLAVAHNEFLTIDLNKYLNKKGVIYDVKGVLKGKIDGKL